MTRACACAVLAIAACGGSTPPATPTGPAASLVANAADPADVIVAHVNGQPVWGSCVAAQAAREHVTREVALGECVDFELLAQAAAARGLAGDPEVVEATRTALVNQVVAKEYEDGLTRPEDFGSFWDLAMNRGKLRYRYQHVEYRDSTYVRVPVAAKPPADDPAAHALADRIAAAVSGERGLTGPDFVDLAQRVAGKTELVHADVGLYKRGGLDDAYGDALWAIPEVGRTSPAVRTPWGYDVILWTDDLPAANPSPDELAREAMPSMKQAYFTTWTNKIAHGLGLHIQVDKQADQLLGQVQ